MKTNLCYVLGIEHPIIAAPMGPDLTGPIRAGLLHVSLGPGRHAPTAAEDQARVIVGILEDSASHRGKIFPLYGPVEFTPHEIPQALIRVLVHPSPSQHAPFHSCPHILP